MANFQNRLADPRRKKGQRKLGKRARGEERKGLLKTPGNPATNPKTESVVAIVGENVVAESRTAVDRTDDPRTATQQMIEIIIIVFV